MLIFGADTQIRTGDLTLTKGVLYQLSHISNMVWSVSSDTTLKFNVWQFPTLTWGDPTLPSALRRFTSEFGMGSGGTTALLPPDKFGSFPFNPSPACAVSVKPEYQS